jgi:hypothetical protein
MKSPSAAPTDPEHAHDEDPHSYLPLAGGCSGGFAAKAATEKSREGLPVSFSYLAAKIHDETGKPSLLFSAHPCVRLEPMRRTVGILPRYTFAANPPEQPYGIS